jgi:hypothetical protein
MDTDLKRTYSGAEKGRRARYSWAGKKTAEGSMVITGDAPDRIDLDLAFVEPFAANNTVYLPL